MEGRIGNRAKVLSYLLMLVYFASYCTRINFAVMLVKVGSDMAVTKEALAVVVTALTISYGGGQIISGVLGDRIKAPLLLTVGLGAASVCNVLMFFAPTIPIMTVVWCINGFAQSLLWPPIVRIMSQHMTDSEYGYAAVRVSWGSSVATIVMYTLAPLLLYVVSWRVVMLVCALVGLSVMLTWRLSYPRLLKGGEKVSTTTSPSEVKTEEKMAGLPSYVFLPIALIIFAIVLQGILRDGVTNWMPSYLCETFNIPEEKAIISTVLQALFSMVSFYVFDLVHRKLFKNEVTCSAVIFTLAVVCSGALYFVNIFISSAPLSLLLMALTVACMHGINLMLITVVPKRMKKSGRVSTWSGIVNSFTYVGASLSTYGFAVLADARGWSFTILMWVAVSLLGAVVCSLASRRWGRFCREYADE